MRLEDKSAYYNLFPENSEIDLYTMRHALRCSFASYTQSYRIDPFSSVDDDVCMNSTHRAFLAYAEREIQDRAQVHKETDASSNYGFPVKEYQFETCILHPKQVEQMIEIVDLLIKSFGNRVKITQKPTQYAVDIK